MMTISPTEANTELIRRLYKDLYWDWDLTVIDRYFGADFHSSEMPPGTPRGPEGVRQFYAAIRRSFADLRYAVDDVIAQGDEVVVRWRWLATHNGAFRGLAPTGRQISLTGIAIYKIADGKVVQRWVEGNVLRLLVDLGFEIRAPGPVA